MKTAFSFPFALSVRLPDRRRAPFPVAAYTPGPSVKPARSALTVAEMERPSALRYAVVRLAFAVTAAGFAMFLIPGAVMIPGGKPVTEDPGERPKLSLRMDGPVLVTVEPARTEYASAVDSGTVGTSAADAPAKGTKTAAIDATKGMNKTRNFIDSPYGHAWFNSGYSNTSRSNTDDRATFD